MKAILLAAGRGSRMGALTGQRPKCLVELKGKPLLEWQLDSLRLAGLSDIAIVTGYLREMLAGRCLTEFHNSRWPETNMLSSLACAAQWLESGPCIVSYTDIFYEPSAPAALMDCGAELAVTYDVNWRQLWEKRFGDPLLDAESFRLGPGGYIAEIGNKAVSVKDIEGQYMGLLRFTPAGWDEVQRLRALMPHAEADATHITGILQRVIAAERVPVAAIPYTGVWGEIDNPSDLSLYNTIIHTPGLKANLNQISDECQSNTQPSDGPSE